MDRFVHRTRTQRYREEVLQIHAMTSVFAAAQDISHRQRQCGPRDLRQLGNAFVERLAAGTGCRATDGDRDAQRGIGTEAPELRRAIQFAQPRVNHPLLARIESAQRGGDLAVDVGHCLQYAKPGVARRVAVAQFMGFGGASRGPGRNAGPAETGVGEGDVNLDRRTAARVEDLSRTEGTDAGIHQSIMSMALPLAKEPMPAAAAARRQVAL